MQVNSEIQFKLGEIHGDVKHILVEAQKTNGRVTSLEKEIGSIKLKIAYWSGSVGVILWILEKVISKYL